MATTFLIMFYLFIIVMLGMHTYEKIKYRTWKISKRLPKEDMVVLWFPEDASEPLEGWYAGGSGDVLIMQDVGYPTNVKYELIKYELNHFSHWRRFPASDHVTLAGRKRRSVRPELF